MPVQPVSRSVSGLVASPSNSSVPGQAHLQVALHVWRPGPALQVLLPGGSQLSTGGAITPSPQFGVGLTVGVGLAVKVGVGVMVTVGVGVVVTVGCGAEQPLG